MRLVIIALVFMLSTFAIAAEDNMYRSQMLGFSVEKPVSWRFLSANTYLEQARQSRLNDPEMQKRWEESMRAPLVVIAKYPLDYPDVNTTFKADAKPYGKIPPSTKGIEVINLVIPFFRANFTDFEIEEGPVEVVLAGHKAGYIKIRK